MAKKKEPLPDHGDWAEARAVGPPVVPPQLRKVIDDALQEWGGSYLLLAVGQALQASCDASNAGVVGRVVEQLAEVEW